MNKKTRLDVLLVERELFPSRESARRAIMAGLVSSGNQKLEKPGTQVSDQIQLEIKRPEHQYVGRGGLKLQRALEVFDVQCTGKAIIDVGASTGGFTDCALQNGAKRVYSIDVGYGQLAWKIRNDERVTVMERTNFRHVDATVFQEKPNMAMMDVSFISTKLLLPKIDEICLPQSDVVNLIKPQFEAGREHVGKGGIVRDPNVHFVVLVDMLNYIDSLGFTCCGLDYSPISGGDGNIEFLGWWKTPGNNRISDPSTTDAWRQRAHDVVLEAWKVILNQEVSLKEQSMPQ